MRQCGSGLDSQNVSTLVSSGSICPHACSDMPVFGQYASGLRSVVSACRSSIRSLACVWATYRTCRYSVRGMNMTTASESLKR